MAHPDVIHETYHISHIAEWFHVFPHVDVHFETVNSTFDPSNSQYLEALGIIVAIPGFWLILTLLAFLIFFLCRCCDSSFKRKRKITPLKWILGLFAILCCGALAVGLYGNETAHTGILEVESASRNISEVLDTLKQQSTKIESVLTDDVPQDLKKLNQMLDSEKFLNQSYFKILQDYLLYIEDNRTLGLAKIQDINPKINSINFEAFSTILDMVEMIRWPVTIGVLCLLIILCFTLIWGVIKHSRCLLILFSVFGLLSVVVCWVLVSLYVGVCVAGSDFCLEPEPFLVQQASGVIDKTVVNYYIRCDEKVQDPFHKVLSEGTQALNNIKDALDRISEIVSLVIPDKKQIQDTLDHLTQDISKTGKVLDSVADTVRCRYINEEYRNALEATCTDTLEGTAFMLVSAVGSGLLFTVLIWVASHTWIHIRKKPIRERVDEADPFLPPSSSTSNTRRNRETYGSTGFRPRSSHTPPHTPYFTASVNGQSGSREDHAFLHGRYTPPPAYEQLSGGHFSGHVGSKMQYNLA